MIKKAESPINALAYWRDYVIHELMFEDWYMDHKRLMYYEEYDYEPRAQSAQAQEVA